MENKPKYFPDRFNKELTKEQKEVVNKANEIVNKYVKLYPPYKPHSTTFPYIDINYDNGR